MSYIKTINWSPGIGDPSIWGWITVGTYLFAAYLCLTQARIENIDNKQLQRSFWHIAFIVLLFLGINKQLDLQSLFTQLAKQVAIENGWYAQRRIFQQYFIQATLISAPCLAITLAYYFRNILRDHLIALSGMLILTIFVVIRASSFHRFDQLIGTPIFGTQLNFIMEITGILLIVLNIIILKLSAR